MNLIRHEQGLSKTESRFPDQGHLPCDLFPLRQCGEPDRAGAGLVVSMVLRLGGGTEGTVRGLCRGQAAPERARLRRSAAVLGADHERSGCSPPTSAAVSIMCWSTNIRTPTACSPRSCWRSSPRAAASPWSATMRNRSIRSAPRPSATSSTSPESSRRRPTSSRSIATTARRSRSSPPPMASSISPRSVSPRTCGPTGPRAQSPGSSSSATRPTRPAASSSASWRTAKPARC